MIAIIMSFTHITCDIFYFNVEYYNAELKL